MSDWLVPSRIGKLVFDVFVSDLEQAIERYAGDSGLERWRRSDLVVEEAQFRGEPVELGLRAAMLDFGSVYIELLTASGDDSAVRWLQGVGDGSSWHPVVYFEKLEKADEARRVFTRLGGEPAFSARIAGSRYWIFDALPILGCRFEIAGGDLAGIAFSEVDR